MALERLDYTGVHGVHKAHGEQDQADVVFVGGNAGRDNLLFSRFPRRY